MEEFILSDGVRVHFTFKYDLRRTGHVDQILLAVPFDVQFTA